MIGTELKVWRKRYGMTQEMLRVELDVSRQTIMVWEASDKPLPRLTELALITVRTRSSNCRMRLVAFSWASANIFSCSVGSGSSSITQFSLAIRSPVVVAGENSTKRRIINVDRP